MAPTMANGKICYIEMPAMDIARSAKFKPLKFPIRASTILSVDPAVCRSALCGEREFQTVSPDNEALGES
jgi:hypothetical protein